MVKPFDPDHRPVSTFQIKEIFVNIYKKTTKTKSLKYHDLRILRDKPPKIYGLEAYIKILHYRNFSVFEDINVISTLFCLKFNLL